MTHFDPPRHWTPDLDGDENDNDAPADAVVGPRLPPLMRPREAAAYLETTVRQLWQWRRDDYGPAYYQLAPRLVRYAQHDLDAFVGAGT
jgi:hypothetical protein